MGLKLAVSGTHPSLCLIACNLNYYRVQSGRFGGCLGH